MMGDVGRQPLELERESNPNSPPFLSLPLPFILPYSATSLLAFLAIPQPPPPPPPHLQGLCRLPPLNVPLPLLDHLVQVLHVLLPLLVGHQLLP
jgi:hypothetical protein